MKIAVVGRNEHMIFHTKKSYIPFYNSIQDFLLSLYHPKRKFWDINI